MDTIEAYYKKTIGYKFENKEFLFKVSQDLFSSYNIDKGTQRLLRTFMERSGALEDILDLGCGYGPIGIILKSLNPHSEVHMTDRDVLALKFTELNAELNKVNLKIYESLGYDNIRKKDFNLIVSNIPAKVGYKTLRHLLMDSRYFLKKTGFVAVVVIDTILSDVEEILSDSDINITLKKSWPGHTVFHYKFNSSAYTDNTIPETFSNGLYDRDTMNLEILGKSAKLVTTYNIQEFDSLQYETQMVIKYLSKAKDLKISTALIFNVNQGYIPVALSLITELRKLVLVDRNIQSLKTAERNLLNSHFPDANLILEHKIDIPTETTEVDCGIIILNEKEDIKVSALLVNQLISILRSHGVGVVVSDSSSISKIELLIKGYKGQINHSRIKYKGKSLISFQKD